jgi:hypothetical protein
MSTLSTVPYANLQFTDSVTGKFMFTDCADKDAFYRLRVSKPVSVYEGSTIYDSNTIFFDNDIRGSASITGPGTSAAMTLTVTGSTVNDYAARQSHFYAHYQPGKSMSAMFSFSFGAITPGIVKRVGLYDVDNTLNINNPLNGILLEQSSLGLTWYIYKGDGTFQSASQASWNVDPLNGSGPSGFNLTTALAEKNLLGFVDLEWLGVGRVRVGFFLNGVPVICQVFNNTQFSEPYLNNPFLPIRYEVRRVSGSQTGTMNAICCSIISEGGFDVIGVVHSLRSPLPVLVNNSAIVSLLAIRLTQNHPRSILSPISVEIASDIGGNANAFYSTYLWRPSPLATIPAGWTAVDTTVGGSGSFVEYNTSNTFYTTMNSDVNTNGAICIKIDEGAISSIAKSSFQFISRSLCIAQSNINKSNRDIIVVVINNTTPNSRNFTALMTWREI